jgi:ferredoxin
MKPNIPLSIACAFLVTGLSSSFTIYNGMSHRNALVNSVSSTSKKTIIGGKTQSRKNPLQTLRLTMSNDDNDAAENETNDDSIDVTQDERLYRIQLSRATGIEWGTDLSFSFVYVRDMEPGGAASMSKVIDKGDQICELRAVGDAKNPVVPLLGASFDAVMTAFASLDKSIKDVELVFFKGSKDELIQLCQGDSGSNDSNNGDTITITAIINKGTKDESTKVITAEKGANLRQVLVDNDINVYQSFTRWTNCKGKQLCGTCIVNMKEGAMNTNRKSMDEGSTLRENPDSYRLSCVTFAYGDVVVETFPPIEAAQWTR